jgi:hypothetical protein
MHGQDENALGILVLSCLVLSLCIGIILAVF